ncbi:phasin family protein [Sphingomonas sp. MMS24-JH45]
MRAMASVKSPTELMKLQADYVRSSFDALVAQTSRTTEAQLKLAGEIAQPLQNCFALAAEELKVAA